MKISHGPKQQDSLSLHIVVVGGGIAGLAVAFCLGRAGHTITLVDSAPIFLRDVGAGIQLGPNVTRLLIRWGLKAELQRSCVKPKSLSMRRYDTDKQVGIKLLEPQMEAKHGAPYYHLHRKDLITMLYDISREFATFLQDTVVSVESFPSPSVKLSSGEVIRGDLIVGADGIKSTVRKYLQPKDIRSMPTGDAAYRFQIPTYKMLHDNELAELVLEPQTTVWMGPGKHIVGYCVANCMLYNMVLVHHDNTSEESWTTTANIEEVRAKYNGWNTRITKLLEFPDDVMKSKLVTRSPLQSWIDDYERIVLVGDSCHPILPYLAQGAAMAIEDAAVLGGLLSCLTSLSELGAFLNAYQRIRMRRTNDMQRASYAMRNTFHVQDVEQQDVRDASMAAGMDDALAETLSANRETFQCDEKDSDGKLGWIYDYDADLAVTRWLDEAGKSISSHARF